MATTTISDFDRALLVLGEFAHREGHSRVPKRHIESFDGNEFRLGSWVANRRMDYRKATLSPERINALEEVPGWTWEPPGASARRALYPGEATAFARAGISPEEALQWIGAGLNAHQALDAARQGQTLEQRRESKTVRPPAVGSRADRDLAFIRRNLAITTGEIAVLAGKEPSAVTHWRRGKKNFPEPVVGGRSPLFNLDEVHDWLELHGKLVNEPAASWLWRKSVQALHQSTGEEDRSRLRGYVSAMVVVLPDFLDDITGFVEIGETGGFDQWCEDPDRDLDDELVEFLHEHLVGMDPEYETSRCAARAFRYAHDHGFTECGLLDEALDALAELSATQTTTSLPITGLITSLVDNLPNPPQSVLDLACGEATLITDFLNRSRLPDLKLRGVEKDPDTAAIARIRLQFHDPRTEADWDIRIGDSLNGAAPTETFDAIVVDPPTKRSKDWVTFARSNLTSDSNSRAFVLLPGSALKADGPCTASIKRKRLEAVVLLPNRLKREARGLALCVLTSDQLTCEEILIIDLSNLKLKNLNFGTVTPTASHNGVDLPVADLCAAISHWRNNRTIDESLLPLLQRSITSDDAVKQGLNHVFGVPSMDDTYTYGEVAYRIGLGDAVDPLTLYDHQVKAVEAICDRFDSGAARLQLHLAAGTGRMSIALWTYHYLAPDLAVVLVPSLLLMAHFIREWTANTTRFGFRFLPVCSDVKVAEDKRPGEDSDLTVLDAPATTDVDTIARFLCLDEPRVVFCTYASSDVLADACAAAGVRFGLVVADEAHRTTGKASSVFATVLDEDRFPADRRLFVTATPRTFTAADDEADKLDLSEFSAERLEDVRRAFTDLNERFQLAIAHDVPDRVFNPGTELLRTWKELFEDDPGTQARLSEDLQLLTKLTAQAFELVGLKARDWAGALEQLMKTRPPTQTATQTATGVEQPDTP